MNIQNFHSWFRGHLYLHRDWTSLAWSPTPDRCCTSNGGTLETADYSCSGGSNCVNPGLSATCASSCTRTHSLPSWKASRLANSSCLQTWCLRASAPTRAIGPSKYRARANRVCSWHKSLVIGTESQRFVLLVGSFRARGRYLYCYWWSNKYHCLYWVENMSVKKMFIATAGANARCLAFKDTINPPRSSGIILRSGGNSNLRAERTGLSNVARRAGCWVVRACLGFVPCWW